MNKKCIGCQIQDGSFKVNGGFIHETENFNVIQDYLIPIPGFMVLQSKRHITSIEEFNEDEQIEFTYFLFNGFYFRFQTVVFIFPDIKFYRTVNSFGTQFIQRIVTSFYNIQSFSHGLCLNNSSHRG